LPELKETLKKIRFKLQGREDKKGEPGSVQEASFWVKRFMETLENADPERATRRLAAYSHRLFEDYREKIAELKSNARPSPVRVEELPKNLKERFISQNGKYLLSVYPRVNIWEREAREKFMDQLQSIDPNVTGNAMHMFKSSELMKQGYIHGGIYAMIAIVLYVLITFKKIRTTLLVLLPVGVGSIWTLGVMDLLGISFNLANLVILPLIIGIGVVNGIHIVHRYREERDKDIPVLSKSTGDAVVLSSLTTMIGFGSLMVADHQGIFSLGLVLTIGVGCCLVASVSFLPAMLKLATRKGWDI
ncbi:MAG: MMPL family transporter, partial [Nitrospinaceae bacterium]|nr:MMPL family transporter [Nitrospinaceae bacterium]NIR53322.1 MMPL family transporter [Nitrospinaceae bacterium]NIS83720.1 MMPL family transporter [Nitrospinaceae bacterium]NIT80518.1 MMPL family transporter [Nitrospinaceae bacterium]NIU42844.1 MMPL family transporter [Nitrospinaceae bacterium]